MNRAEDRGKGGAQPFVLAPAGELFGEGIEVGDALRLVGGDDCIADAPERGGQPSFHVMQAVLRPMAVEGHLDGCVERLLLEGLDEEAKRFAHSGLLQRTQIGIGRDEHHRRLVGRTDLSCGRNAVHLAVQADVHEHEVGVE